MLILNRKVGESITIGDDIEVKVLKVFGNMALLGICAPGDVSIDGMKVRQAKQPAYDPGKKCGDQIDTAG